MPVGPGDGGVAGSLVASAAFDAGCVTVAGDVIGRPAFEVEDVIGRPAFAGGEVIGRPAFEVAGVTDCPDLAGCVAAGFVGLATNGEAAFGPAAA